ncbi:glycosyltransferase family 2 protein [Hymenobacter sp. BT730]|uniref:glycosyltransferase family 2 protein n=1 Tax=Hymenobacter sp. BT730 TaxID=3063332 RepID=UPI0026DEC613|nr:glycosyltransferase family 2 protein [Hymenobacter sp. BT730]
MVTASAPDVIATTQSPGTDSTSPQALVTLSIVTWNSAECIEACLRSVLNQSYAQFELWVVDNASADDTCAIVAALAETDNRIRLHQLDQNTGFCGGHNYTLNRTSTEAVLLVNPDTELAPDYLERALAALRKEEDLGVVCGLLLQSREDDARIDSAGMLALPDGRFALRLHGVRQSQAGKLTSQYVDGADGALPLYRRQFIDDLRVEGEFFDPRFFAHKEDWDIAWRGQLLGWRTLFEPACRAIHPRQFQPDNLRVRLRMSRKVRANAVRNQWIMLIKNTPKTKVWQLLTRALPRQLAILGYLLVAERSSLSAVRYVWQHRKAILASRHIIQSRARAAWAPARLAQ